MRRFISLFLAFCLVLSLTACGGSADPSKASSTADTAASSSAESTASSAEDTAAESSGPEETYEMIAEQTEMDKVVTYTEHFSFTKGELAYYFALVFKNYYSYLSYFGVDTTVSLKEQQYSDSQTWFDVFLNEAENYTTSYLYFCEAAAERGITLTQDDYDYIDAQKEYLDSSAAEYGWDAETYLKQMFGTNISWDILSKAMEKMLLADRGYEAFVNELKESISREEIMEELNSNPKKYGYVDFVAIDFLYAEGLTDADKTELAAAFNAATDADSFKKAVVIYVEKSVEKEEIDKVGSAEAYADKLIQASLSKKQSYQDSSLMDWIYSSDRSGNVFVEPEELEGSQYAYLLTAEPYFDEDTYVDVRHILALTSTYGSIEAAHAKAEEIYAEWQAGAKTEDSFANLAIDLSEDGGSAAEGGLYEGVYRGQMVEPFENWCFDESRKSGDTGIVDTEYGAHIMYFVGSYVGWYKAAMDTLMNGLYDGAYNELVEKYPITTDDEVAHSINW